MNERSYAATGEIQKNLRYALTDVVYAMNAYASLYNLTANGEYEISFDFDDSVQTDRENEKSELRAEVMAGLSSDIEYRMKTKGETEQQAIQALVKIMQWNAYKAKFAIENQVEAE